MRKINITIEFEDSDIIEHKVRSIIDGTFGNAVTDIRTLPNTKELYNNDKSFQKLVKSKKDLQLKIDRYINDVKLK